MSDKEHLKILLVKSFALSALVAEQTPVIQAITKLLEQALVLGDKIDEEKE